MSDIDWTARAVIHRRSDAGSEMHYQFDELAAGPLAAMVRHVAGLPADERARLIMDVAGRGNLDIHEILALAARPDLPPA